MTHLVLGRIRKLPRRFQRLAAGILITLLPFLPCVVIHEWPTDPSDNNEKHFGKLENGASTETNILFQNSPTIIPLASQNFSNTSTASQYALSNKSQRFFRAAYNYKFTMKGGTDYVVEKTNRLAHMAMEKPI